MTDKTDTTEKKEEKRKPFFVTEEVGEPVEVSKKEEKNDSRDEEIAKEVPEIIGSAVVTPEKEERQVHVQMNSNDGENIMWDEPKKSSKGPWVVFLVILLILLIGGAAGFFYMKKGSKHMLLSFSPSPTPAPTATPMPPTPTPTINLTKYTISVLNGSGVSGAASKTKSALTTAGFSVKTTGNAATSDYTTTVISAKSSVDSGFLQSLVTTLKQTYSVDATIKTLDDNSTTDVVVTIGTQAAQ